MEPGALTSLVSPQVVPGIVLGLGIAGVVLLLALFVRAAAVTLWRVSSAERRLRRFERRLASQDLLAPRTELSSASPTGKPFSRPR